MIKNIIAYSLAILCVVSQFHIDMPYEEHFDGYSICDVSCNEKHHSDHHFCDKCLNNSESLTCNRYNQLLVGDTFLRLAPSDNNVNCGFLSYNSYSRPPPSYL